jgi:type III restriction enzyme
MQEKEKLLSFSEKTAFIFAHSALREGWDNPNVFNICLLKDPVYETTNQKNTRRQELGRGLRIAVNQNGERVQDETVNILTVVCPESFEKYVKSLQEEYEQTGDVVPPAPSKAKREKAKRNDDIYRSVDFRAFWNNLSKQTEYALNIDTPELITSCSERLNSSSVTFPEPQIVITRGEFVISNYTFSLLDAKVGYAKIKLSIADVKGRNDVYEQWCPVGYDFGRKSKDVNLNGFKIVQIEQDANNPVLHFGNGVKLYKDQPHAFSGNPDVVEHQRSVQQAQETYPVFNLIDRASKALGLTRPTIIAIFKNLHDARKEKIFINPEGFASIFIKEVKEQLANHVAERIEYKLTNDLQQYQLDSLFPVEKDFPQRELIPGSAHSLYDQIQTDSDVERNFVQFRVQEDDKKGNVIAYFKFPASFKIRIPKIIGNYNPDWGIIRFSDDGQTKVQLVRETKGTMNPNLLQFPNEKRKIDCAKKHFKAIGVKYRQVNDQIVAYWEDGE